MYNDHNRFLSAGISLVNHVQHVLQNRHEIKNNFVISEVEEKK
jgi:hypothetical protein